MPNQIKGQTGKNYGTTTISDSLRTDAGLRVSDNLHEVSSRENATSGTSGKTGGQNNTSRTTDLTDPQIQSGQSHESGVELDRLAKAVAKQETANCTKGSAKVNNCFGIMAWTKGKRHFKAYPTKEASYEDFKRLWAKSYGGFPTLAKAKKYSGNDRAHIWLKNVTKFYNEGN